MNLATITVTYNPDLAILEAQLRQLPIDALRVVVDNASDAAMREALGRLCADHGVVFIANAENLGLATGLNIGARKALELAPELAYLLLLDQDTEPGPCGVETLVNAYETLLQQGYPPGCAGPRMVDAHTGLQHGFHCMTRWRWQRRFPPATQTEPVRLANLNGSGTLIPAHIYRELGGLDDALFIDHVDTEWSFRVLAAGYALYGMPQVGFIHRMGEASVRFWLFGWRVWPSRSPRRHYFLFRNAVILMRRDYVPGVWKAWAVAKLLVTFAVHALTDPRRKEQCRAMLHGLREGLESKAGH
ncbi:MAG: glycosyltransferase [Sinobacteraceae bacterium]|nr:glycosyltransferase [Nevskiaceae bacterium]